jgi:hypothetical protein
MTAMIVLSWSKATRDLLRSFGWGIAPADLEHAPDRRNRKRHRLYRRVDRRLAERRRFSRRGTIEFHDARAPLEYLGHVSRREQSADGFAHGSALRFMLGEDGRFPEGFLALYLACLLV